MPITSLNLAYLILLIALIGQRLFELTLSKRNEAKAISNGGIVIKGKHYLAMVLMHGSWLLACLVSFILNRGSFNSFSILFFILFLCGQSLRILAIKTLKERWTTTITIHKNIDAIHNGIYRYIRHPNYVGVIIELFAFPMIYNLLDVAIVFSLINLIILKIRIHQEENALAQYNNYQELMHGR